MKKIVIIDNYDSFTYNLLHMVKEIGADVTVVRNDCFAIDSLESYDGIILSPGPGIPSEAGLLMDVIRTYGSYKPVLGVCLGHQAMAEAFGATVSHAGQLMHGKTSQLKDVKTDSVLFQNLTLPIQVARYHSLAVKEETLPEELVVTARSEDNEIMAMEHREYPIFGLQFHPESVMTPQGLQMIENFIDYAKALKEN